MLGIAFALAVAGLFAGPWLGQRARTHPAALAALDGATLALVPGFVLVRVLPHLIEESGAGAVLALVGGYLALQVLAHRSLHPAARTGFAIVIGPLAVHSFFDGAALSITAAAGEGSWLVLAALLMHRVPEGLFIGSITTSARAGYGVAALLALATAAGVGLGQVATEALHGELAHLLVAAGLGGMLQLIVHRHVEPVSTPRTDRSAGIAFLLALGLVVAVPGPAFLFARHREELSVVLALVPMFLETAPLILVMALAGELVLHSAPRRPADAGGWLSHVVVGASLLGGALAVIRAALVPVLSWLARRLAGGTGEPSAAMTSRALQRRRWSLLLLQRPSELFPAYVVGLAIAVATEVALPPQALSGIPAVVLMTVLALLSGVVGFGVGGVSIAAVIWHKGAPAGAVLAFLLADAAMRVGGLASTRPTSLVARGGVIVVAVLVAALVGPLVPRFGPPELHALGAHTHRGVEWLAAGVLAGWVALALAAAGPRRWFSSAYRLQLHNK